MGRTCAWKLWGGPACFRAILELWEFSALDIEAALYAEMLAYVYQTARHHITQDNTLHDYRS
jgi:hypothetical protein